MSIAPPKVEGFVPIAPIGHKRSGRPVMLSGTGEHGRYQPALRVVINPQHFKTDDGPAWLAPGKKVWAMQGVGEFSGTLRLMPSGVHELRHATRGDGCLLIVPPLRGQPKEGFAAVSVEFDYSDGWFDIILPPWQPKPLAAVKQPVIPAVPPPAKPFTLAAGASSHPLWSSPKAQAEHKRAVEGGAA